MAFLFNVFSVKAPSDWLLAKVACIKGTRTSHSQTWTCVWMPAGVFFQLCTSTIHVHVCFCTNAHTDTYRHTTYKHDCKKWIFWPKSPHLGGIEPPRSDLGPTIFCLLPPNVFSMLPSVSPQYKVGALFKPLPPLTHMQEKDLPMMLNSVDPPSMLQPQPKSHAVSQPQTRPSSNSLNNGGTL